MCMVPLRLLFSFMDSCVRSLVRNLFMRMQVERKRPRVAEVNKKDIKMEGGVVIKWIYTVSSESNISEAHTSEPQ